MHYQVMNAIGSQRREAVERGTSSATRGIGLRMAVAGFGLSRSFALPVDGKDRRKDLISRRLRQKQSIFEPFLILNGLISRRLRRKRPFFIFQSLEVLPDWHRSSHLAGGQSHRAICSHL
jgi:hypothetical protein